jgi:hypothetical protein
LLLLLELQLLPFLLLPKLHQLLLVSPLKRDSVGTGALLLRLTLRLAVRVLASSRPVECIAAICQSSLRCR